MEARIYREIVCFRIHCFRSFCSELRFPKFVGKGTRKELISVVDKMYVGFFSGPMETVKCQGKKETGKRT
jgi:hypothetical protein